jgi:hypothetical protein
MGARSADPVTATEKYTMTVSRLTVDKLGIHLYDKVWAVLAELIANAYDANAENVTVKLPFDTMLAKKHKGVVEDLGYAIEVRDDGLGMSAGEVNARYLEVGANRRAKFGDRSPPPKSRLVMGRKGIGKLAPFGICKQIEVLTAGGESGPDGTYEVSHLILNYEDILSDTDADYHPVPGPRDGSRAPTTGTSIVLREFTRRRVPKGDDLHRRLAARFGVRQTDWTVEVVDANDDSRKFVVGSLGIDILDGTRVEVGDPPVRTEDGEVLPVSGWVGYAREPYKDEAMAGVRIFARGKLVAQTRDFDISAGFTGEFKLRSYIVGEVHAEWLDTGDDDLVRSDRQDIIWSSEKGEALRRWGQALIKNIAKRAEASVQRRGWSEFLERSQLTERLAKVDPPLRQAVTDAARVLVQRTDREALRDPDFVESAVQLAWAIGPHRTLLEALHLAAAEGMADLPKLLDLFRQARIAEVHSLGQVARERLDALDRLRDLIRSGTTAEFELQKLIEEAPWILHPDWTPLTENRSLKRVRESFEIWYEKRHGEPIVTSAIQNPTKRPDFVMLSQESALEITEIKRPDYALTDDEADRAFQYLLDVDDFLNENRSFPFSGVSLMIVCDKRALKTAGAKSILENSRVTVRRWEEVLNSAEKTLDDFLEAEPRADLPPLTSVTTQMERVPASSG